MMIHIIFKMKKILLLTLLLTVSLTNATAQITLGHCGEGDHTGGVTNNKTDVIISAAMGLTPALQDDYTFCSISYLRIYLVAPENFNSLNVWVRKNLSDTENMTSIDVDPSTLSYGWNDIELPNQIALNGSDSFYCGYSYQQSVKTLIPTNGTKGTTESFYVSTGSSWRDMSAQYAPVCIRAGLSSNYGHAIELTDLRLEQRYFEMNSSQDTVTIHGTIRNLGNERLHHFTVSVQDSNNDAIRAEYECNNIYFGYKVPFVFKFQHSDNANIAHPDIPIVVNISHPNGEENQNDHPSSGTLYYELGQSDYDDESAPKSLFIEEFTSENNGYSPSGQTHLRNSINRALELIGGATPEVILLSRHEGYGPADAWHVANSDYDASFFGSEELTFAPAAMVCRNGLPFSTTLSEDSIASLIAEQYNTQCGTIEFEDLKFDSDNHTISATIKTHLMSVTNYMNPTLVVCVKQEKAASVAQKNYYPETYDGSWQHDVVRKFFSLSRNGKLLGDLDLDAVAAGQVKVSDYVSQQYNISDIIPSDITSSDELKLVAYIFDKNYTNKIIAVHQAKF